MDKDAGFYGNSTTSVGQASQYPRCYAQITYVNLLRTAKALKAWRRRSFSNWKLRSAIMQLILQELERAQERRTLTSEELEFKKFLKSKLVWLAVVQKSKAKQHSRLKWIRYGDTNSRQFHMFANVRRKQNFISSILSNNGIAVSQQDKSNVAHQFFSESIGTPKHRNLSLNWEALGYEQLELDSLDSPFSEQEIAKIIKYMPPMKAPGPDGFIRLFYKKCWEQ